MTLSQPRINDLLSSLSRRQRQSIAVVSDFVMMPLALWTALALRLGQLTPEVAAFWPAFATAAFVSIPVFMRLGLYRQVVRYMGDHAMLAVVKGATITAVAVSVVAYMAPLKGFPRSVPVIFWLIALGYIGGTRFAVRGYIGWLAQRRGSRRAVIIYGAGSHGVELARTIALQGDWVTVAFVDDDPAKRGRSIDRVAVHPPGELARLFDETGAKDVLIAIPSTAAAQRKQAIELLEPFPAHVRLIPDLFDLGSGQSVANVRDVRVEDLLGRDAVEPLPHLLTLSVRGQCVLVTGAGGSIGSELCRQVIRGAPRMLLLLDQNEFGLFQIHRELRRIVETASLEVPTVAVLGSVADGALLRQTMNGYRVDTVYHAAAYKHVTLVERNVIAGLKNNTFGTLYAAEAAVEAGVKRFILVSTDKAVRTTNVMGASKRLAEMTLQAMQVDSPGTIFSIVRFGNVLGSSGSVVPLFLEQIESGGPVTVTHADATRYFMTIPEAAQLVVQAGSMAEGGDVFLLDMGAPVRILDLARRMIRLKGFTVRDAENPHGDIEIQISGLQAGEKVHEQLLIADATSGTQHRKIMRAEEKFVPWAELRRALNTLEYACESSDYQAIKTFIEHLVEGASLEDELVDLTRQRGFDVVALTKGVGKPQR